LGLRSIASLPNSPSKKIGMLATFGPSIQTMEAEFEEFVRETGSDAKLTTVLVDHAIDRLRAGDAEIHNRLLAKSVHKHDRTDAIMLVHFSTSVAEASVQGRRAVPILSAPKTRRRPHSGSS
jgi:hypothetical protein